jgi:hypothetical protein
LPIDKVKISIHTGGMAPSIPPTGQAAGVVPPSALEALLAVLRPLARLAIDQGVQFGQLEELLKRAMVEAALRATAGDGRRASVPVSRLSVVTGIHRKEVKRLSGDTGLDAVRAEPTPAAELFTRWVTDAAWCDAGGRPRVLARRPPADGGPSFEQLARTVTTDVHPRSMLDELLRLDLVTVDAQADTVALRSEAFVPSRRLEDMLAFLGANVGDHLSAAAANVAASQRPGDPGAPAAPTPFVEQALYADALSVASAQVAADRAREHWSALLHALAPELQRLEDADRDAARAADQRIRIGLYCYAEPMPPQAPAPAAPPRR